MIQFLAVWTWFCNIGLWYVFVMGFGRRQFAALLPPFSAGFAYYYVCVRFQGGPRCTLALFARTPRLPRTLRALYAIFYAGDPTHTPLHAHRTTATFGRSRRRHQASPAGLCCARRFSGHLLPGVCYNLYSALVLAHQPVVAAWTCRITVSTVGDISSDPRLPEGKREGRIIAGVFTGYVIAVDGGAGGR